MAKDIGETYVTYLDGEKLLGVSVTYRDGDNQQWTKEKVNTFQNEVHNLLNKIQNNE